MGFHADVLAALSAANAVPANKHRLAQASVVNLLMESPAP